MLDDDREVYVLSETLLREAMSEALERLAHRYRATLGVPLGPSPVAAETQSETIWDVLVVDSGDDSVCLRLLGETLRTECKSASVPYVHLRNLDEAKNYVRDRQLGGQPATVVIAAGLPGCGLSPNDALLLMKWISIYAPEIDVLLCLPGAESNLVLWGSNTSVVGADAHLLDNIRWYVWRVWQRQRGTAVARGRRVAGTEGKFEEGERLAALPRLHDLHCVN